MGQGGDRRHAQKRKMGAGRRWSKRGDGARDRREGERRWIKRGDGVREGREGERRWIKRGD